MPHGNYELSEKEANNVSRFINKHRAYTGLIRFFNDVKIYNYLI